MKTPSLTNDTAGVAELSLEQMSLFIPSRMGLFRELATPN
jgi:hypothetical protein